MERRLVILYFLLICLVVALGTVERTQEGRRMALVMGNAAYLGSARLTNPVNDARAVASALEEVGFAVTRVEDAPFAKMSTAIRAFVDELGNEDTALFYFSGHGLQSHGENYLIPTDFDVQKEESVVSKAIGATDVQRSMGSAREAILVFDACRDNPYLGSRELRHGLAQMEARGTLIAYAAASGQMTRDNQRDENGLFATKFLEALREPGLTATALFQRVRREVYSVTSGSQWPAVYDDLLSDFVFREAVVIGPLSQALSTVKSGSVAAFRDDANQGDTSAQYGLALMYYMGEEVSQDDVRAVAWLRRAADQGYPPAQNMLGVIHQTGRGVLRNPKQAIEWFHRAADQGETQAMFNLGIVYYRGVGARRDEGKAIAWFRRAADKGHAEAQNTLGLIYLGGLDMPRDESEAIAWFRRAADQGHVGAQSNLGFMYLNGRGVPRDDAEAFEWYSLAADQGHAEAQATLGAMFVDGRGIPQDDGQAVVWFGRAADKGHPAAQNFLGVMYTTGRGVHRDEKLAVAWFHRAADQEFANAQVNLGVMYRDGRGVPQDDDQAARLFRWAADQDKSGPRPPRRGESFESETGFVSDKASAQASLAAMYEDGRGVPKNHREAAMWYLRAAYQGHVGAQSSLGIMYEDGRGVPQDDVFALMWQTLAAGGGDKIARQRRDALSTKMSAAQVASAEQAALSWRARPTFSPRGDETAPDLARDLKRVGQ